MHLKRFITDHAKRPKAKPMPITRKECVAIIGAGPSGLTAALELRKRGYGVTVFEEMPEAGGMLRWGIPAYRLPREELNREIQDILNAGVELRTNVSIGKDRTYEELKKDFDIIYLAVGAQKSAPPQHPRAKTRVVFSVRWSFLKTTTWERSQGGQARRGDRRGELGH
jgi:NADPH-dependent glutamate synthase beta subunit-like oxidoreductase